MLGTSADVSEVDKMKLWLAVITLCGLGGLWIYIDITMDMDDADQVKAFIDSRGKGPVPPSWRGEVGKGI